MAAKSLRKCVNGHLMTEDNVYKYKVSSDKFSVLCKTCVKDRSYNKYWNDPKHREKVKARSLKRFHAMK